MKLHSMHMVVILLLALMIITACAAPQPTPQPVDSMGTMVAQLASSMQTQTAAAASPTPLPVTDTPVPTATETQVPKPTRNPSDHTVIVVTNEAAGISQAACWFGPGPAYNLESNIFNGKKVELLGVGSIPGWYIIKNPYFYQPCWISASELKIDPAMDLSAFPVIAP